MPSIEPTLQISLFGPMSACIGDQPVAHLKLRKGEWLLAYLALNLDRPVSTNLLARTFWPEQAVVEDDLEKGAASLRASLKHLRDTLKNSSARIEASGSAVCLHREGVEVDVDRFDWAVHPARSDDIEALKLAIRLHQHPLLEGWGEKTEELWVNDERQRRKQDCLTALQMVASRAIAKNANRTAAGASRRCVLGRPLQESGWYDLMQTLILSGERLEAMDIYRRYRDFLARYSQGKVEPAARFAALYQSILEKPALLAPELNPSFEGYEPVGGAVPVSSPYYVARPADGIFHAAIARRDSVILVKGPRQIGKTSLLARGLVQARKAGSRVVLTHLQKMSEADFQSLDRFFFVIAQSLAAQLDLDIPTADTWTSPLSPPANFERFIRRQVLERTAAPVVWAIDEADRLFPFSYRDDMFALFRSWHNERALDPGGPWERMTLALAYATEAHLFIANLHQSPFNVGTRVTLEDLSLEQVEELNHRYGNPLRTSGEVSRLFELVGGHPYLVRLSLYEMQTRGISISDVELAAERTNSFFSDHLDRMALALSQDGDMTAAVRRLLVNEPPSEQATFFRLRAAGVVLGDSPSESRFRCRLYKQFLARQLA
jgi:DNA-binding transcriptional activator of the SARP family